MRNSKIKIVFFIVFIMFLIASSANNWIDVSAHDGHGHSPKKAKSLKSPFKPTSENINTGKLLYEQQCASCHGLDGKSNTDIANAMVVKPTDLTSSYMKNLTQGEIYWAINKGIIKSKMPSYNKLMNLKERWQTTLYVETLARFEQTAHSEKAFLNLSKIKNEDFIIRFKAKVGNQNFNCGESYENIGITNSKITPTDFALYLSNIRLKTRKRCSI